MRGRKAKKGVFKARGGLFEKGEFILNRDMLL